MSEFLDWHPASINAQKAYQSRIKLQNLIYENPINGIEILRKDWKFGEVSEIWDDFIFDNFLRPVFDKNESSDIKHAIRR